MIAQGTLGFSIESRILRELGERLVKNPEVALVELIKNSYDADALECTVDFDPGVSITVADDGDGMTLDGFAGGWMRIGTSSKESANFSGKYRRQITGEKGIGRFAVRFLGRALQLKSIADDPKRGVRTRLIADFDWPRFDRYEDLGSIEVPYKLFEVGRSTATGTTLIVTQLRPEVERLNLNAVRTGAIGVLTPLRSLFRKVSDGHDIGSNQVSRDPGLVLRVTTEQDEENSGDVAEQILDTFVLRATLTVENNEVQLRIFGRDSDDPHLEIVDTYSNCIGNLYADIRFFPRRKGAFTDMPLDGRRAQSWISKNHGVAVFDRYFRVPPYGSPHDDWLRLQADAARNRRDPRSNLAKKHFPMSAPARAAPAQNWMLRLPQSLQLVGLVQVEGSRFRDLDGEDEEEGLVASADREGFVENRAFFEMYDLVRGAVEAIAYIDRELQLEREAAQRQHIVETLQDQARAAIDEIRGNADIAAPHKERIITVLAQTSHMAEIQREASRAREQQLEIMSLLGIVAGFMTHEFGVALQQLHKAHRDLLVLARRQRKYQISADNFANHIERLKEFSTYSSGYIQGARTVPDKRYTVAPRLLQVKRIFGEYAEQRNIDIEIEVDRDLIAPPVPVSLYSGIALNLYTNALKAITAKSGGPRRVIHFRAWNKVAWHFLEVSDTGIGIPPSLYERVFDPLFTTTESRDDPLGSGMGLGLSLVRRSVEAYGGVTCVAKPRSGFSTCIRVRLPLVTRGS